MKHTKPDVMEFFVLASIARGGLHSLYELQQGVGLQPGAIHGVLKSLEADGFLERSEQQRRRKRLMTVTEKGEKHLRENWESCLVDYPDVESTLRTATIALLMDQKQRSCGYLVDIADQLERCLPVEPEISQKKEIALVESYMRMRWRWECSRRRAAARAFRDIAKEFGW
jgi:DNA-binding MarR family transcriptional regulator